MSYKYINGYYEVTTQICDGYVRFNRRNAQYSRTVSEDGLIVQWDFVSYAYPVMTVSLFDDGGWEVTVTHDCCDCSRTTSRQISDFLKFIHCPITYHDIKETINCGFAENYLGNNVIVVRGEVETRFAIRFNPF